MIHLCEACNQLQSSERCVLCSGPCTPTERGVPTLKWIEPVIGRAKALELLEEPWTLPRPDQLEQALEPVWLAVWRADLRLDTAWEAEVARGDRWELRAGWIDVWIDDVQMPGRFAGVVGRGNVGLGRMQDRVVLFDRLEPPEPPWREAVADKLSEALGTVRDVWAELPPEEIETAMVAYPAFVVRTPAGPRFVDGVTGTVVGPPVPDAARARRWSIGLALVGVLVLTGAAALVLPGLLIWPLLLLTLFGAVLGFGLVVASTLPPAVARSITLDR